MEKTKETCNSTNTQEITIKERLEILLSSVTDIKEFIMTANTSEAVQNQVNKLAKCLLDAQENKIPYVSSIIEEETLPAVHQLQMHDITRNELAPILDKLIELIKKRIAHEEKNEKVEKLRSFFLACAENAEKLIDDPLWANLLN